MMMTDMMKAALAGFNGEPSTAYFSSPLWLANKAGAVLAKAGYSAPKACVMGPGYSVKVASGGQGFKVKFWGGKLDKSLVIAI
jgi:hypothetical protein